MFRAQEPGQEIRSLRLQYCTVENIVRHSIAAGSRNIKDEGGARKANGVWRLAKGFFWFSYRSIRDYLRVFAVKFVFDLIRIHRRPSAAEKRFRRLAVHHSPLIGGCGEYPLCFPAIETVRLAAELAAHLHGPALGQDRPHFVISQHA